VHLDLKRCKNRVYQKNYVHRVEEPIRPIFDLLTPLKWQSVRCFGMHFCLYVDFCEQKARLSRILS